MIKKCKNSSQNSSQSSYLYTIVAHHNFSTTIGAIGMDASYKRLLQPENANEISQAPHPTPSSP